MLDSKIALDEQLSQSKTGIMEETRQFEIEEERVKLETLRESLLSSCKPLVRNANAKFEVTGAV